MTTESSGSETGNLRTNVSSGEDRLNAASNITGAINAARAVSAAELEDLRPLVRAIAACARRERARKTAVFEARSAEAEEAEAELAIAEERRRVVEELATESSSEVLRLLE